MSNYLTGRINEYIEDCRISGYIIKKVSIKNSYSRLIRSLHLQSIISTPAAESVEKSWWERQKWGDLGHSHP